jgi:hypothetical protein
VGEQPGSSGTYDLSGGSLSTAIVTIGQSGSGAFTQTGGTHSPAAVMRTFETKLKGIAQPVTLYVVEGMGGEA